VKRRGEADVGGRGRWLSRLLGRRRGSFGGRAERPAPVARGGMSRFIAPLALLVGVATVVCAVLGLALAWQADDNLEGANRKSLRGAIEALQVLSPDVSRLDPALIRALERVSGLKDLRFDFDPPGNGRAMQSLLDEKGRIVGWFSWQAQRPSTALMFRLLPLGALIAAALLGLAALALWQLNRMGRLLVRSEQAARRLADEDPVTGLSNQRRLLGALDDALAVRQDGVVGLALIEFGGFEQLKDAIGSGEEDEFFVELAERLRAAVPNRAALGRLQGGRFALVMVAGSAEEAMAIVKAAREACSRAIWLNQVVEISAHVGLALAPRDGTTRGMLRHHADLALRAARRRGRGAVAAFSAEMEAEFEEQSFIKRELARALSARALDVHYQPIVKSDSGAIVGVEALLRWHHPIRGDIPPAVFTRVAEAAGLMDQIGEFVLRRALTDAGRWPHLYVAVNLSAVQVRDPHFVELMASVLDDTKIAPARVVLEMTEKALLDDPLTAKARLEELRAIGVKLALDDFGAGQSSLAYLQQLPFHRLKIDRGFVAALDHSATAGVVIQAMAGLGRALGLAVLIEGVETEEQRVLLRLAGCTEMQGFLFAKPAPRQEIDRLVAGDAAQPTPAEPTLRARS
jgi:diguanylate cyclase (GGDEF)-like protein